MNVARPIQDRATSVGAFTLIEMLVYMGVSVVILGLAFAAAYKSMDASAALRRSASDISRALDAGERWRADVRAAANPPRIETVAGGETILHLPQPRGEIEYRVTSNSILRRVQSGSWSVVLRDIKSSAMIADRRENIAAWRWELELKTSRKTITRIRPLFTFIAVPAEANR